MLSGTSKTSPELPSTYVSETLAVTSSMVNSILCEESPPSATASLSGGQEHEARRIISLYKGGVRGVAARVQCDVPEYIGLAARKRQGDYHRCFGVPVDDC